MQVIQWAMHGQIVRTCQEVVKQLAGLPACRPVTVYRERFNGGQDQGQGQNRTADTGIFSAARILHPTLQSLTGTPVAQSARTYTTDLRKMRAPVGCEKRDCEGCQSFTWSMSVPQDSNPPCFVIVPAVTGHGRPYID